MANIHHTVTIPQAALETFARCATLLERYPGDARAPAPGDRLPTRDDN